MAKSGVVLCASLAFAIALAPAWAGKSRADANKLLDSLEECQNIQDSSQRLACFDSRIGVLKTARQQDKKLFSPQAKTEFSPINATAASVAELEPGTFLLVLSDHSVWKTDDIVRFEPKRGDAVKIVKGALGSYLANIANQRAVHIRQLH